MPSFKLFWFLRLLQQFGKAVVYAGHSEIRLTLEGAAKVMNTVTFVRHELDNCQYKVSGLLRE